MVLHLLRNRVEILPPRLVKYADGTQCEPQATVISGVSKLNFPQITRFPAFRTMNVIEKIGKEQMKTDFAPFNVGDNVKVHVRVVEGGKERVQLFAGIVIAKQGIGISQAFTVRKISYNEGVERVFPIHSPKIAKVEVIKEGKVRRAKLNYLRTRIGKAATTVKAKTSNK